MRHTVAIAVEVHTEIFVHERFEAEVAEMRPAARKSRAQQRLFQFLDGLCSQVMLEAYLRDIADTDRALSRQLTELLELIRQYGPEAVAGAIERAATARASPGRQNRAASSHRQATSRWA